jgi:hypothetical protein
MENNTDAWAPDKGGVGKEKEEGEVAGRGRSVLWTCYNDGAGNYYDPSWSWITCWRCGVSINLKTLETRMPGGV